MMTPTSGSAWLTAHSWNSGPRRGPGLLGRRRGAPVADQRTRYSRTLDGTWRSTDGAGGAAPATPAPAPTSAAAPSSAAISAEHNQADIAFAQGMIPHHQGAIDMARIVQQYGDDPQTKEWAAQIIAAQEAEIAEMQAWLEAKAGDAPDMSPFTFALKLL